MSITQRLGKKTIYGWTLISRTRLFEGDHKIKINRKQISVNHPEAVKLFSKEIENEE